MDNIDQNNIEYINDSKKNIDKLYISVIIVKHLVY
jgi:hypothetical protein